MPRYALALTTLVICICSYVSLAQPPPPAEGAFYWQSNIYSREAWSAQWNALAVVNVLLLGVAISLLTSDVPAAAAAGGAPVVPALAGGGAPVVPAAAAAAGGVAPVVPAAAAVAGGGAPVVPAAAAAAGGGAPVVPAAVAVAGGGAPVVPAAAAVAGGGAPVVPAAAAAAGGGAPVVPAAVAVAGGGAPGGPAVAAAGGGAPGGPAATGCAGGCAAAVNAFVHQLTAYKVCLYLYQICLVGLIACCVGGILSSTIFVMEINSKAQPMGFGDAKEWAQMANRAVRYNCEIFSESSGVYTAQPLQQVCREHNTVDNHIRRLMCGPLGISLLNAPTNFTWAAFFFFSLTITCYIAAKYETWLLYVVAGAVVAMIISSGLIYSQAIGHISEPHPNCNY